MANGKFITLEGGEGSGKSTQARLLEDRLLAAGVDVVMTREPGGSPFGERLRDILLDANTPDHAAMSEALLFYAARSDHLDATIRPALSKGHWVICDRFSDSTRAYQGYAGALSLATIDTLDEVVVAPTFPDLTMIIDLDPKVGMQRADARRRLETDDGNEAGRDRFEGRSENFHRLLRDGFLDIAAQNPERCAVIDGADAPDAIGDKIWEVVCMRLRLQERA